MENLSLTCPIYMLAPYPGSPPHVRERRAEYTPRIAGLRITPACAGKTKLHRTAENGRQDHPRMCGKDSALTIAITTAGGSPPHVRERLRRPVQRFLHAGITPACAGKTLFECALLCVDGDHPRMCGKDRWQDAPAASGRGSPPHVRERRYLSHCIE